MQDIAVSAPVQDKDVPPPQAGEHPGVLNCRENGYKRGRRLAIVALVLSLSAYGIVPILIRWCEVELSPEATIFNRCWIAALILAGWKLLNIMRSFNSGQSRLPVLQDLPTQPAMVLGAEITANRQHPSLTWGITITASVLGPALWAWSLTQTTVANSALIHSLTPLFTTVGSWLVFKAQFERRFWLGVLIAVGGAVVLGLNDVQLDFYRIQGDLLALIAALFVAIYLIGTERLKNQVDSISLVFWFSLAGTIVMLLVTFALGEPLFPVSFQGWLAILSLAIVGQLLALGLVTYSLSQLSASLVALVFLLDPVLTAIAAWFAFAETLNLWNIIAFVVILSGIYLGLTAKQYGISGPIKTETSG